MLEYSSSQSLTIELIRSRSISRHLIRISFSSSLIMLCAVCDRARRAYLHYQLLQRACVFGVRGVRERLREVLF